MRNPEKKTLEQEVDLLNQEMEMVASDVVSLRREYRADLDRLTLELETLRRFLREAHPELTGRFRAIHEQVRHEVSPE